MAEQSDHEEKLTAADADEHSPDLGEHQAAHDADVKEEPAAAAAAPAKPAPKSPASGAAAAVSFASLADPFKAHASKGSEATSAEISKWCKDAGIVGKTCDSGHVDISFTKAKAKGAKNMKFTELEAFIDELCVKFKTDAKCKSNEEAKTIIIEKLHKTQPKHHGTTKTSKTGGVAKMTDTKSYTGSHKERFDETGKGKGKEGRADTAANNGYVGAYKDAGTYDKKKAPAAASTKK